jgi:RNA polymerase sigma-70 factor (ECF subfamily)
MISVSEGFTEVYQREFEFVWRALRRFGVKERHLEDVTQEVFVVLHRRLADYDPSRPIRPWLTGIAFRVAADHRGRAVIRRELVTDEEIDPADERPLPDEILMREERRALLQRALLKLDDNKRAAFIMHDMDGHSIPEIAAALDVPVSTMYSRLRLARAEFTKAVAELRAQEECA